MNYAKFHFEGNSDQNEAHENFEYDDHDDDALSSRSYESARTPGLTHNKFLENASTLKIQINGEIQQKSSENILEILKMAATQGTIEIKIKGYSDLLRARISQPRENLEDDDQILIETDEEDNQSLSDDALSIGSSISMGSASSFKISEVTFQKTSDLVILQSFRPVAHKISNFAISREVVLKLTSRGYQLKGENPTALKEVEDFIRKEQNNLVTLKVFKDQDLDKIKAVSHSLRNIHQDLAKKLGVTMLSILPSNSYYYTYKKLASKIPILQEKLKRKTEHNNLRVILYQENIQKDKFNEDKFLVFFSESCKSFIQTIKVEHPEFLPHQERAKIFSIGAKFKFFIKYRTLGSEKIFHVVEVHAYYKNDFEERQLFKKFGQFKRAAIQIIKPRTQYPFIEKFAREKYEKFVLPEIEDELKLKKVNVSLARAEPGMGEFRHQGFSKNQKYGKQQQYNFALQIEGPKKSIFEIKKKIAKLMKEVPKFTYEPTMSEEYKPFILPHLGKFENRHFLYPHFKAIETSLTDIKLIRSSKIKFSNQENGLNRGGFRGGRGGRGSRGGRGGGHYGHNNHGEREFVIEILYKNNTDLVAVTKYLDRLFTSMISIPLYIGLSGLLAKQDIKIDDFKTEYNLIIFEFEDKKTQKPKTVLIGEKGNVDTAKQLIDNLSSSIKPIKQTFLIQNNLLMNAFKSEIKGLVPREVNCRISGPSVHLFGNSTKVKEAETKIQNFINQRSQSIKNKKILDLPSSSLKAIQGKWKMVSDWEHKNHVKINFIKPNSSKIDQKTGLQDKSERRLVVVKGDITKIQVDAIVNSTNLLFNNANILQGVAKAIADKAGDEYIEDCKDHGELKETQVFTSVSGKLTNCQQIINVCPPLYTSDANLPLALQKLRQAIRNLLREAEGRFTKIAVPLLSAGNYGIPPNEAITCIVEELASGLFKGYSFSTLKEIFICEVEEEKIKFLEQKMRSIVGDQINTYTVKYQWQWEDDGRIWKDYDLEVNRRIDQAFHQNQSQVEIKFPASRAEGSHVVDLINKILRRISTGQTSRLERKQDGWYENGTKMNIEVSEILDLREAQGNKVFQIFITEYLIDFSKSNQINLETKFPRNIKRTHVKSQDTVKSFIIPNVLLIQQSTLHQGKKFGEIIVEGFSESEIANVVIEIKEFMDKLMGEKEIFIIPGCGEANIKYLENEIEKHQLIRSGSIQPGKKISLKGNKMVLFKIEQFFSAIGQVESKQLALPNHWKNIDEENCNLQSLATTDQEYQDVVQRFRQTLGSKTITSIKRIQNPKFWRDYSQEKDALQKLRARAGIDPTVKEEMLWHGTRGIHPSNIYAGLEECFDMQYANDGMWGRGLYFAVNSQYSDGYAHPTQVGTKLFMLCRVMIGDTIDQPSNPSFRKAPERLGLKEKISHESIKGLTGGSVIYILYRMRRAYPEYLIEYK